MAKKITDLTALTTGDDDDYLALYEDSSGITKKIKLSDLYSYIEAKIVAENYTVPVGAIEAFAMETPPSGWLECDGSAISRVTYSDLFTAIGTVFGVGDGSTTFNIPDFRGRFLRGWDNGAGIDPDAASRTDSGDGSTTGDHVGTKQADEFESHTHTYTHAKTPTGDYGGSPNFYSDLGSYNTSSTGGNETRPVNTNVMYCIKI